VATEDALNFVTEKKVVDEENDLPSLTFDLDGVEMEARPPKEAALAQIAPISSHRTPPILKVKLALDLLDDILVEPGRTLLRERLRDPDDDLDARLAVEILTKVGDRWNAIVDERKAAAKAAKR
jgi:hypothetical protein